MVALEFDPGLPGGIICPQLAKHQLGLLQKEGCFWRYFAYIYVTFTEKMCANTKDDVKNKEVLLENLIQSFVLTEAAT